MAKKKKRSVIENTSGPRTTSKPDVIDNEAMLAMMKARLAYAQMHGNPAAQRMVAPVDNYYQFPNGDNGSHYMSSMDNYAVPQIQNENGQLQLDNYGPRSNEAIRFDNNRDAEYFAADNYKKISPAFQQKKYGGDISQMGYRDDSPYRNEPFIDIDTQGTGLIDMSNTGIPLDANGVRLEAYSGVTKVPVNKDGKVRETAIDDSNKLKNGGNFPINNTEIPLKDNDMKKKKANKRSKFTYAQFMKTPAGTKFAGGGYLDYNPETNGTMEGNDPYGNPLSSETGGGATPMGKATKGIGIANTVMGGLNNAINNDDPEQYIEKYVDGAIDAVGSVIPIVGAVKGLADGAEDLATSIGGEDAGDWTRRVVKPWTVVTQDWLGEENARKQRGTMTSAAYGGNIYQNSDKDGLQIDRSATTPSYIGGMPNVDAEGIIASSYRQGVKPAFTQNEYMNPMTKKMQSYADMPIGYQNTINQNYDYTRGVGAGDESIFVKTPGLHGSLTDLTNPDKTVGAGVSKYNPVTQQNETWRKTGQGITKKTGWPKMNGYGDNAFSNAYGGNIHQNSDPNGLQTIDLEEVKVTAPKPATMIPNPNYDKQKKIRQGWQTGKRNTDIFTKKLNAEELKAYNASPAHSIEPYAGFDATEVWTDPNNPDQSYPYYGNPNRMMPAPTVNVPTPPVPTTPHMLDANTGAILDPNQYPPGEGQIGNRQYSQYVDQANAKRYYSPEGTAEREQAAASLAARKAQLEGMTQEEINISRKENNGQVPFPNQNRYGGKKYVNGGNIHQNSNKDGLQIDNSSKRKNIYEIREESRNLNSNTPQTEEDYNRQFLQMNPNLAPNSMTTTKALGLQNTLNEFNNRGFAASHPSPYIGNQPIAPVNLTNHKNYETLTGRKANPAMDSNYSNFQDAAAYSKWVNRDDLTPDERRYTDGNMLGVERTKDGADWENYQSNKEQRALPKNKAFWDQQQLRINKNANGGRMENGGLIPGNPGSVPTTEFNAGGSHDESPLGGIPQGMNPNGKPNLVEEGELKIIDPRDDESFIISPKIRLTKDAVKEYGLDKRYIGKDMVKVFNSLLRRGSRRTGDSIEEHSKELEIGPYIDAHKELSEKKNAEEDAKKQVAFDTEMAKMQEAFPERMEQLVASQQQEQAPQEQGQPSEEEMMMMQQQMQQGAPQGGMPQQGGQPSPEEMAMMQQQGGQGQPPMMANGGNMYKNGDYLNNPYLQDNGSNSELWNSRSYERDHSLSEFDNTDGASTKKDEVNTPKIYSSEQTLGNQLGQFAPMAANLAMGLFGKEDKLELDRATKVNFDKLNNRDEIARIGMAANRASKGLEGNANASNYLTGKQALFNSEANAISGSYDRINKQNTAIENQEKLANMRLELQNLQQGNTEKQYSKAAKAAKSAQLMRGIDQLAEYNRAQQEDDIAFQYANMGVPDYRFEYSTPYERYLEDQKNKKAKKAKKNEA